MSNQKGAPSDTAKMLTSNPPARVTVSGGFRRKLVHPRTPWLRAADLGLLVSEPEDSNPKPETRGLKPSSAAQSPFCVFFLMMVSCQAKTGG